MPYSPPNTFTTKLVASEFSGNSDALRVYLHEGIPTGDIAAADQFETRHIVGPPLYDPTSGACSTGSRGIRGDSSARRA
jgi:hypothetical protein